MTEDQLMRNRGYEPCPDVMLCRCERWFGVAVTFCLVGLCFFSALVRVWVPSLAFSYETGLALGLRVCLVFGAVLGIVTGVLCLVSLCRACISHPGRVWYRVADLTSPVLEAGAAGAASSASNSAAADTHEDVDPGDRFRQESAAYFGAATMRHCVKCDRPKPPTVHHCSRCRTCVDRMDHHCPWIGQCVGRENHKYFTLFLFYTAVAGLIICVTSMPNFIRFCTGAFRDPNGHSPPPPFIPPPPPTSSSGGGGGGADTTPAPTVTGPSSSSQPFGDVDFLMVVVFFLAGLFGLMLMCFFGTVWDSAIDGSTQLDRAKPYDATRTVEENALYYERARSSKEYLRRWSMGRGSAWAWFLPTTPLFDEDSISHV